MVSSKRECCLWRSEKMHNGWRTAHHNKSTIEKLKIFILDDKIRAFRRTIFQAHFSFFHNKAQNFNCHCTHMVSIHFYFGSIWISSGIFSSSSSSVFDWKWNPPLYLYFRFVFLFITKLSLFFLIHFSIIFITVECGLAYVNCVRTKRNDEFEATVRIALCNTSE